MGPSDVRLGPKSARPGSAGWAACRAVLWLSDPHCLQPYSRSWPKVAPSTSLSPPLWMVCSGGIAAPRCNGEVMKEGRTEAWRREAWPAWLGGQRNLGRGIWAYPVRGPDWVAVCRRGCPGSPDGFVVACGSVPGASVWPRAAASCASPVLKAMAFGPTTSAALMSVLDAGI